jgi:hypothetical protein
MFFLYYCLFTFRKRKKRETHFMDHLAVCGSNRLKLGLYLYLTLIHNPEVFFVDLIICLCFMDIKKQHNLAPFRQKC